MEYFNAFRDRYRNQHINFDNFDIEETEVPDEQFFKFLKRNDIYGKFLNNINNVGRKIKYFFERADKSAYVSSAFNWDRTPEGFKYWDDINRKWLIECARCPGHII